ncbi:hypothetical protein [Marinimicrobium agarilyticum]|uniref:hypothetical protein n=1 Tax=Marinimicrobium agarilyticum TaxID=306546 RepID=UPI000415C4ED|nr:hypothetical protein [Marinimicrobium agarilyticum]
MDTLTSRIYALLSEVIGTALILGLSGEVHTTVHYDTRSGFLNLNVFPVGANPDEHRNRVTVLVTEDDDTLHKLQTLDAYLRNVIRYGYLAFCGFPPLATMPPSSNRNDLETSSPARQGRVSANLWSTGERRPRSGLSTGFNPKAALRSQ